MNAPTLRDAGLRYHPAYLFSYLERPSRISSHIGTSRMPDYQLTAEEWELSLARPLVLVIGTFVQDPRLKQLEFPPPLPEQRPIPISKRDFAGAEACSQCHTQEYEAWSRSTPSSGVWSSILPANPHTSCAAIWSAW